MKQRKRNTNTMLWALPLVALMFLVAGLVKTATAAVADFRVTTDTTATDTSKDVIVIVEILNEDGEVDPFAYQGLAQFTGQSSGLKVDVATLIGEDPGGPYFVNATHRGVVMIPIDYQSKSIGRDTISITVTKTYYDDQGYQRYEIIGTKTVDVDVTAAPTRQKNCGW